jgi:hypothetical protein
MSAMTITVGTGLQGGANRSGYVYDGLTQYPDLAWSEGYVFRGGTGWWQEWETIFGTYDAASASDLSTNYAATPASTSLYASNLGTGWTAPYSGLFPSEDLTGTALNAVIRRSNFIGCPPFLSVPFFVPWTGASASASIPPASGFAVSGGVRRLMPIQSVLGQRPTVVLTGLPGRCAMSFSGVESYSFGSASLLLSTTGFIVVFRTAPGAAAKMLLAQHYTPATPANIGNRLGIDSGKSAMETALASAPTVIINPGPAVPNVTVNDGGIHALGLLRKTVSTTSPFVGTDSTDQTVTFAGNTSSGTGQAFIFGKTILGADFFSGEILDIMFIYGTVNATLQSTVQAAKADWAGA